MTATQRSNLKGALYALGAFALFASHDAVVKILGATYAPMQILFFSVLLSFPLVVLMLMRDTTADTLIPHHPWWTALRMAAALATGLCVFYAFTTVPLAQVYSIIFAMPLLITILSIPILGERVGPHRWAAVAIGLVGVMVVIRPGSQPLTLGHLAALAGAFFGAFASIIVRKIGKDERNAVLLVYPMMGNFVVMAAALPLVYEPMPLEHLGLVGIMAILAFCGGLMVIRAYKAADAAIVAPMQYSQIIWAALFGAVFFQETNDRMTWIGAGIIIASGIYIVLRESFGGLSENTPVLDTKSRPETGTSPRVSAIMQLREDRPQ